MKVSTRGFTIVELLIVIVVIAILAEITVVAYNGIQNRANGTAVQSDLKSWGTQIELFRAMNGKYPIASDLTAMKLNASKNSYDVSDNAFLYCADTPGTTYGIVAKSKNKTSYTISSSSTTVTTYSAGAFPQGGAIICPTVGSTNVSGTWPHSIGSSWVSWVAG